MNILQVNVASSSCSCCWFILFLILSIIYGNARPESPRYCENSTECRDRFGYSSRCYHFRCVCDLEYELREGKCQLFHCTSDSDCTSKQDGEGTRCKLNSNRCECQKHFKLDWDSQVCYKESGASTSWTGSDTFAWLIVIVVFLFLFLVFLPLGIYGACREGQERRERRRLRRMNQQGVGVSFMIPLMATPLNNNNNNNGPTTNATPTATPYPMVAATPPMPQFQQQIQPQPPPLPPAAFTAPAFSY